MTITRETQQIVTTVGPTFVCYARQDEAFVLDLAAGLRARSVPIWIDQWNIEPGADWSMSIDAALSACASFLIVLSPEAVASDEVRGELRVALNTRKRIIPLLYRPCDVPRQLLLTQHLDFTQSSHASEASLDALANVLRAEITSQAVALPGRRERGNRQALLDDVGSEARDRLRSIATETPVPIQLERQPHQVSRWWDDEAGVPVKPPPTPAGTNIVAVFDEAAVGGRLLILGAPGSGKTTVLLQLMQELAARADLDQSRPVPVLISLASWKNEGPVDEWLVGELRVKYGVRPDVGMRWRDEGRIAPLFDGLDELPAEWQQACVEAINAFQDAYRPSCLVVCCRRAEYENLTVKLRLRGAVSLLPLEPGQIRAYLGQTGCADLWNVIGADPELMEMARSPLLLSFMTALPDEPDAQRWQDAPSGAERRQHLFDAYLSSRASPAANHPTYSREQTLRWLHQLARMLHNQQQPEFLIERMQPDWLESPVQQWSYRAGVLIVSASAVAGVVESISSLSELVPRGNVGLAMQESTVILKGAAINHTTLFLIAITVGCLIAARRRIVPVETLTWSWSRAWSNAGQWGWKATSAALDYGTPVSVTVSLIWLVSTFDLSDDLRQRAGELAGIAGGVLVAVSLTLVRPSAWLRDARWTALRPRLTIALAAAVVSALVSGWAVTWIGGLMVGLSAFLVLGVSAAFDDRRRSILLRWLLASLIGGVAVAALSRPVLSASVPLVVWWQACMSGALAVGMIAGLAIGLATRARDWWRSKDPGSVTNTRRIWTTTAVAGLAVGISLGLAALVSARVGSDQPVRAGLLVVWYMQIGFLQSVLFLLFAIAATAAAVVTAGVLGALAGALSGATGADIERRLAPNQGIRQSAVNVTIFATLGVLIIGVPYGVLNVTSASLTLRTLPTAGDWLRLGVGAGVTFGLLAGLLPGAACIQHFVLRFVLWANGTLPLRCARFLNFATRRRLLQRVGGRYRFIHELLRDHLGDAAHARAPV